MPPSSPQSASGSERFSSHFEKAISNKNDQLKENDTGRRTEKQDKAEQASVVDETERKALPADPTNQETGGIPSDKVNTPGGETLPPNGEEKVAAQNPGQENLLNLPSKENMAAEAFFVPPAGDTVPGQNPNGGRGDATGQPPFAFTKTSDQPFILPSQAPEVNAAPAGQGEAIKAAMPQNGQKPSGDALLAQLQQIIANSNEKGTVTISRENTSPPTPAGGMKAAQAAWHQQAPSANSSQTGLAVMATNADATLESPHALLAEGWNAPAEKTDPQAASQRQNTQQQYYEAKINLQSFERNEESMAQERQQGSESAAQPQTAGQTSTTPASLTLDQTNTFAQTVTSAQSTTLQPGTEAGKALTLPSGTVVRDEEVIQQVMERFQISRRTLDTQINIKLHPAELGELKIDLTVKEGSIRANVVAQSQHAQEIIERNMTRLRGVLENHGFTVESITVTAKSDSTADAGLFDRQFFGRNEYSPQPSKRLHEAEAAFRLDEAFFPAQAATTGVNVKI